MLLDALGMISIAFKMGILISKQHNNAASVQKMVLPIQFSAD